MPSSHTTINPPAAQGNDAPAPITLVFATNNGHKLREVRQLLGDAYDVRSLADIGCHDDIAETAATLEGNALLKARHVSSRYHVPCFADDTGLEVDALGGEPGIHTARYAELHGEGSTHDATANMRLLLREMAGKDVRTARFRTVIALIKDGEEHLFEGVAEGTIARHAHGHEGFGYDPVFRPAGHYTTFAEMTAEAKNAISHRGQAIRRLADYLLSC